MEKEIISPPALPKPSIAYTPAVRVGPWLFISGLMSTDFKTGLAPEAKTRQDYPTSVSPVKLQVANIFKNSETICKAAGTSLDNLVRIEQFRTPEALMSGSTFPSIQDYIEERNKWLKPPVPASTGIPIEKLLVKDCIMMQDWIGIVPNGDVKKEKITAETIATASAGFAHAIRAGRLIFVSGMLASDYKPGHGLSPKALRDPHYWYGSDVKIQANYIFDELELVLSAGGTSLDNVVKAMVYLTDMRDLYVLDEVWRSRFPNDPPARTIIPISSSPGGVPGAKIEITVTAIVPNDKVKKESVSTDDVPFRPIHEPHAVKAEGLLFLSGQMAVDEGGLSSQVRIDPNFPYFGCSAIKQTEVILGNVKAICEAAGTSLDNIVKIQCFYTDLGDFFPAYQTMNKAFGNTPPACTTVQVKPPLPAPEATILIDLIGMIPKK